MAASSTPKTPTTPTDMDISEWELASCSTSSSMPTTSSTSAVRTPISMIPTGTDQETGEEAMQVSGSGAKASGEHVSMELELRELDARSGWPQAYLEIADHCHDYPYHVAQAVQNKPRNRYPEVSPYDHNRILLRVASPAPGGGFHPGLGLTFFVASRSSYEFSSASSKRDGDGIDNEDLNNYINASLVTVEKAQRSYILTQCPLTSTYGHFWLMVWQQNSRAVIMLSPLMEDPTQCSPYYPISQGQRLLFEEIGLSVHMLRKDVQPFHTVHYLSLENMMTGELKPITHFHYTNWPIFGVPESPAAFLSFLFMVRGLGYLSNTSAPVVIHCTGGIGRSGVFTLIDACLVLMEKIENPFTLNIRQVLVDLRRYRMGLVQTPEELRFSYVAVIEGAKFLMGDESIMKKWVKLTKEDHARCFTFYTSGRPCVKLSMRSKVPRLDFNVEDEDKDDANEKESDYSDPMATMSGFVEHSSASGTQNGDEDECKPGTSFEGNQKSGRTTKPGLKRKRFNL